MVEPRNLVFFLSDNHARSVAGCYGHPLVRTPNLDQLANDGVRFDNAYCASPLCCPARASLATGRYPHQTGYWDNAIVYDGKIESWMHRLRAQGHKVVSIGKLHFRSTDDDNGFTEEIVPMHILDGRGGVSMLLRSSGDEPTAKGQWELYTERSGIGGTHYQDYDRDITKRAIAWLRENGQRDGPPWVLFVSYASPHPPFQVPERLFNLYPLSEIDLPADFRPGDRPEHPAVQHLRQVMGTKEITDADVLRHIAAGYFGLITHVDEQIGEVLGALAEARLRDVTRVLYTSDHGELFGAHGLFGKSNMYEGAVGVPLIVSGPGIPRGRVARQIVSHVDLFPTVVEAVSGRYENNSERSGVSLWPAMHGDEQERLGFVEYHATGTQAASFVLREGAMKLIYHIGMSSQLFDLETDPAETHDLMAEEVYRSIGLALEAKLREICDPESVDSKAQRDQAAKVAFWGGKEAVAQSGSLVFTPPPGATAEIQSDARHPSQRHSGASGVGE